MRQDVPMDKTHGLFGSLLPQREDSIPELEPLLVPVLNLEICMYASTLISLQKFRPVKGRKIKSFSMINLGDNKGWN